MFLKDYPNPPTLDSFPQSDYDNYGKNRWKRMQVLADVFWKRWQKSYLNTLEGRSKWTKEKRNLKIGDYVIIKDKNVKRNEWRSGIVDSVFLSNDNVVRSCVVRTTKGCFRRCVKDIVLLHPNCEPGMSRQSESLSWLSFMPHSQYFRNLMRTCCLHHFLYLIIFITISFVYIWDRRSYFNILFKSTFYIITIY